MKTISDPPRKEVPKFHGSGVVLALKTRSALNFAHASCPEGNICPLQNSNGIPHPLGESIFLQGTVDFRRT